MDGIAELYRRFIAGDDECFEAIVAQYYSGLVLYLYGLLDSYQDAEDIAQDTLLALVISKPPFKGDDGFKTWLYRIAANRAKNHLRSKRRVVFTELTEDYAASKECDPEALLIQTQENANLYAVMKTLNKDYYQALYLRYIEELSLPEISHIMRRSQRQVTDLLYRGRESLRKKMGIERSNDEDI
ncbi:MAG: sigma-70 family RNA polymerase sigma factor [Lachnospiraceae bacterium]|nr:sigma-70 family RNA polymerase sigma factor [Lachnospiraceae bacterium]